MTKTTTIQSDDEPAILARADEIRAARARRAADEAVAAFAPLLTFMASDAWVDVRATAAELAPAYSLYPNVHNALMSISRQMGTIEMFVPADARGAAASSEPSAA